MTGDMAEAAAAARTAKAHLSQAAALKRLSTALESPLQTPSKGPDIIAAHRSEHRMGVPGKVASDPEAFVRARTDTLTFPRIAAEVARALPPGPPRKPVIHPPPVAPEPARTATLNRLRPAYTTCSRLPPNHLNQYRQTM